MSGIWSWVRVSNMELGYGWQGLSFKYGCLIPKKSQCTYAEMPEMTQKYLKERWFEFKKKNA